LSDFSWTEYTRFTIALTAVLDPLAVIPVFLGLTRGFAAGKRARAARVAALSVAIVLATAALTGESLLAILGTSLAAFRVGGGIVILMMAISMLMARPDALRHTPEEAQAMADQEAIAVVPLGIPLLAGPGAISTVIIQMDRGHGLLHVILVLACIAFVAALCWLVLHYAEPLGHRIGPVGVNVLVRVFGLLLAAIAVEYIVNGLKQMLPVLATAGGAGS